MRLVDPSGTAVASTTGDSARTWRRVRPGPMGRPLQVVTFGCDVVADVEPQSLGLTYWFDTATDGEPYPVAIRFTGRRVGVKGKPEPGDSFNLVTTVKRVVPGSGPAAVTTRARDVTPGTWQVTATPITETGRRDPTRTPDSAGAPRLPSASASGVSGYGPVIRILAPGARFGAWPALVMVGAVVALASQAVLARRIDLPASPVLLVSLAASLIGLVAAKLYYLVEHRGRPRGALAAGMCIQGFVIGAVGALVVGAVATDLPVGRVLDVSAPGLLFGMAIGRLGCLLGGCCAGRPTRSRWGLWSSDRHIGVRRVPTQLMEAAAALSIGLAALAVVGTTPPDPSGTVFVSVIAAYTIGRQLLFPLRDLPRHTPHGRALTTALAASAIALAIALALFGSAG